MAKCQGAPHESEVSADGSVPHLKIENPRISSKFWLKFKVFIFWNGISKGVLSLFEQNANFFHFLDFFVRFQLFAEDCRCVFKKHKNENVDLEGVQKEKTWKKRKFVRHSNCLSEVCRWDFVFEQKMKKVWLFFPNVF